MTHIDPNSFSADELKDGSQPNPTVPALGTDADKTVNTTPEGEQNVDWEAKFKASAAGVQKLLDEIKTLKEGRGEFVPEPEQIDPNKDQSMEALYPGFEELAPDAQNQLIVYTNNIKKSVLEGVYQNPAIKHAVTQYNTTKWDNAFAAVSEKFPDLKTSKDDFKSKYFKADIVPDNIESILTDLAKSYLFDKSRELGAEEERKKQKIENERVELERTTGGNEPATTSRTLADWQRMAVENPQQFAKLSKEYNDDLASGRI